MVVTPTCRAAAEASCTPLPACAAAAKRSTIATRFIRRGLCTHAAPSASTLARRAAEARKPGERADDHHRAGGERHHRRGEAGQRIDLRLDGAAGRGGALARRRIE